MKKLLNVIILATLINLASVRPASALIIDPASLAQKITEWVGKISDATNKIQQQIQQIKLSSLQGFKKDFLADVAGEYLKDYATDFAKKQIELAVKNSKEKEKKKLSDQQEFNKETQMKYYEAKTQMIEEQLKEAKDEEKTREENVKSICQTEVNQKKSIYENLKKSNASDETIANAADDYERSKMKCDEENMALAQAKKHKEFLEESKKSNEEEKQKVGTAADPVHQKYQERIDAISQLEEKTVEIGAKETNENWDDVDVIEAYTITESEYVDFINQYFINESNIQGGLVGTQTEIDRVMRERRRLFINTAVHLLQVSGSTRRDIKTKTTKIKELYDEVRTTEDEFKAIGYYSGSKIDNIRALVLYAKILSTKLQYMAAKDLLTIEPSRRGKAEDASYDKFDLTKYKLTDSYVKAIEEDSNKGIDIHEGVSAE